MASAASEAENLVLDPISRALSRRASRSSPVAPEMADTWLMEESKSAVVFTAAVPIPVMAAVTGIIFLPAEVILSPTCSSFLPASSIPERADVAFSASCSRRRSSSSVSTISLCRASYLSCPRSPFSNCCFAYIWASLSASSFSFVAWTASFRSRCFCDKSSVFFGSSLRSLVTSFSWLCVLLIVLLTDFSDCSSFVVSPPISTVIPFDP